jgi:hypothetical protein
MAGSRTFGQAVEDLLDAIPFPGGTAERMAEHVFERGKAGKSVEDAAVAPIDFGGFHEPLAGIARPRRERAHEIETFEQVEVAAGGFSVDAE